MKGVCGGEYVPEECFRCKKRKLCEAKEKELLGDNETKLSKKKKAG